MIIPVSPFFSSKVDGPETPEAHHLDRAVLQHHGDGRPERASVVLGRVPERDVQVGQGVLLLSLQKGLDAALLRWIWWWSCWWSQGCGCGGVVAYSESGIQFTRQLKFKFRTQTRIYRKTYSECPISIIRIRLRHRKRCENITTTTFRWIWGTSDETLCCISYPAAAAELCIVDIL